MHKILMMYRLPTDMKHLLYTTLAVVALSLPLQALEQRTFYSADKSKSFDATLTAYDAKKKTVTVKNASGKTVKFAMNVISDDCQEYVLSKQDLLSISKNVRLKFKESKDKQAGNSSSVGFSIEAYNRGKNSIDDVTLNYTIYYDQGNIKKGGFIHKTKEGSVNTGKMYNGDTLTVETDKVYLVRKVLAPVGGG